MVNINTIKCGNSSAVYNAAPVGAKSDEVARRKKVAIHFGAALPVPNGYRVIARVADGSEVVLALADSHEGAVSACWARTRELPKNATGLRLEKWEGSVTAGKWVPLKAVHGELPKLAPVVKGANRRLFRRARKAA